MTSPRTSQGSRPPFRRGGRRRRQCFCKENTVDYKDVSSIRRFITDRGRIEAGKKSGNCAKCQRNLTTAIKRARHLALLPFAPDHLRVTGSVASSSKISEPEDENLEDGEKAEAPTESGKPESRDTVAETSETGSATEEGAAPKAGSDGAGDDAAEQSEAPEDTVEVQSAEADEDDSTTGPESEEPSDDVSTSEPEAEADAEPEAEASTEEEDK